MKYMKKIALALVIGCSCMGLASCSEDGIGGLIDIITSLFGKGESYTYNLETSKGKIYIGVNDEGKFENCTPDTTLFRGHQVTMTVDNNNLATLTFPDYNWQQIQITNLVMRGLTISTVDDISYLEIGDNSTIDGTFTFTDEEGNVSTYTADAADFTIAVTQKDIAAEGIVTFSESETAKLHQQLSFEFVGFVVNQEEAQ